MARTPADYGDPTADQRLAEDVAAGVVLGPPGPMAAHLTRRTAFFDRELTARLDAGLTQVVVVGAGYDGRPLRYARTGARFFELDHPVTQADKVARLTRLGVDAAGVVMVPVDFGLDDAGRALAAAGHDGSLTTFFYMEGVAVYLERDVLERLLGQLASRAAPGSQLAVSLSLERPGAVLAARRAAFRAAVAAIGEPARTYLHPDDAVAMFRSAGWDLGDGSEPLAVATTLRD